MLFQERRCEVLKVLLDYVVVFIAACILGIGSIFLFLGIFSKHGSSPKGPSPESKKLAKEVFIETIKRL